MTRKEKLSKKYNSMLYNHLWLKYVIEYGTAFILSVISAAIFAFGMVCFMDPNRLTEGTQIVELGMASGGVSGLSQSIQLIFSDILHITTGNVIYSICYFGFNIPIIIFAFSKIGKRFTIFTLVNVLFVSLFANFVFVGDFFIQIATVIDTNAGMLGRAFFAGLCTGLSSAIAFKIDSSAGGFDIFGYYFSLKKGNNTGHYIVIINAFVIFTYAVLSAVSNHSFVESLCGMFFSVIYLFTVMLLIDLINVRNKKAQIEIVTDKEDLPDQLIAYIPHGATLLKGKGVYTGKERFVVHMVVSINEVKKVVKIVNELDKESFVNVTQLQQVYGRFHMKPVK